MSTPDPMRAFRDLSLDEAKRLGEKMGYRVIISDTGCDISSKRGPPAIKPNPGELGLYLNVNNKVAWAETGKAKPPSKRSTDLPHNPSFSERFDPRDSKFTRIPIGIPPLSYPVFPGKGANLFSIASSPNAPITPPPNPAFPPYHTAGSSRVPYKSDTTCATCKKDLNNLNKSFFDSPLNTTCSVCQDRFCSGCFYKHGPCKRNPTNNFNAPLPKPFLNSLYEYPMPLKTLLCASCKTDLTQYAGKGHSISNPCPVCHDIFCYECHFGHKTCQGKRVEPPLIVPGG